MVMLTTQYLAYELYTLAILFATALKTFNFSLGLHEVIYAVRTFSPEKSNINFRMPALCTLEKLGQISALLIVYYVNKIKPQVLKFLILKFAHLFCSFTFSKHY